MLFHHFFLFLIESSRIGGLERGKKNREGTHATQAAWEDARETPAGSPTGQDERERTRQRAGIAEGVGDFHVGGSEGSVDEGCMRQMLSCVIILTHGDKIGMARMVFFM